MNKWISVKIALPENGRLCEVKKNHGQILSPVRLTKTQDQCLLEGYIKYWIYKSGIFAGYLESEDMWLFVNE